MTRQQCKITPPSPPALPSCPSSLCPLTAEPIPQIKGALNQSPSKAPSIRAHPPAYAASAPLSSPVSFISMMMSHPPTSSPAWYSCGYVGHCMRRFSPSLTSSLVRMSKLPNDTPSALKASTTLRLNLQRGSSGVPWRRRGGCGEGEGGDTGREGGGRWREVNPMLAQV